MFSNSGDDASSAFLVQRESSSLFDRVSSFCQVFCGLDKLPLVDTHGTIQLRYTRLFWRDILFALTVHHQIGSSGFCHQRSITRGCVLSSFRHDTNHTTLSNLRERTFQMAAGMCRKVHDIKQKTKGDSTHFARNFLGQNVSKLLFGVNVFDLDFGVQVRSVKQPIKSDSVSSRHRYHRGTSSFNYHFHHGFDVFKDVQLRLSLRRVCVGAYVIHFTQLVNLLFSCHLFGLGFGVKNCARFLVASMFGLNIVFGCS